MTESTEFSGQKQIFGHPQGLFYLFFAELWERFSFYGMRALLTLYMIDVIFKALAERDYATAAVYSSYGSLVYASTVIGGKLSDKILGMRNSIFLGGILMSIGHFVLAIENNMAFFLALSLIIVGNGFFKPNISTFVGTLYEKGDPKTQSLKLVEEVGEICRATLKEDHDEVIDGIGDCVVVLTNLAELHGVSIEECIASAYGVISKRTGKMVNGTFKKD